MRRNLLAAGAAALVFGSAGAHSGQTSTLLVSGEGSEFFYSGYPGLCQPGVPAWPDCQFGFAAVPWKGTLTIKTDSDADGTYTGSDLLWMTFSSGLGPFTYHAGDVQQTFIDPETGESYTVGMAPGASVTISGGRVTDVEAFYAFVTGGFALSGLSASEFNTSYGARGDLWSVAGMATSVPEPAAAFLLMAGLAGCARRFRRARPA